LWHSSFVYLFCSLFLLLLVKLFVLQGILYMRL
jgi:hypothetical protein